MVREGIDTTFIHKSIQEYYTARFIKSLPDDETSMQAYNSITKMRLIMWASELRFLEQIDPIRYKIFFRKQQIGNFLNMCVYRKEGRKAITKDALKKCLSYFNVIKIGSNYIMGWSAEGIKKMDSILFFEIAVEISAALKKINSAQVSHSPDVMKIAMGNQQFLSDIREIFASKIKISLSELDEIADAERKRKIALLNILNRPIPLH